MRSRALGGSGSGYMDLALISILRVADGVFPRGGRKLAAVHDLACQSMLPLG